jgi:predicted alpha/beta superfamily hydrolase
MVYTIFQTTGLRVKKLSLNNKIFNSVSPRNYHRGFINRQHYFSNYLKNARDIDIYLPPSYKHNHRKHYPVIYMHDGNNLFFPSIAFAGVPWHVDHTIDKLVNNNLMDEVIVVGIHNTNGRDYEYTWTPMRMRHGFQGGGGHLYAKFITEELKPFIDQHFRTLSDRNNTSVIGSSLGGLISFYLGLYYPHVFSMIGMFSPSLWWGNGIPFKHAEQMSHELKIWIDMGTKEGYYRGIDRNMNIMSIRFMRKKLLERGYADGYNLAYFEDKGGKHNEYSWGKRLHLPLMFFFGKRKNIIFTKD